MLSETRLLKILSVPVLVISLLVAACGEGAVATPVTATSIPATPTAPSVSATPTAVVATPTAEEVSGVMVTSTENPQWGTILADADGRSLYLFSNDERNKSKCSGSCASIWPPLTTVGEPVAGAGIRPELLGTITRGDGSIQVTYNGWPLYYYTGDRSPGDANGQNSGSVWFVVSSEGEAIRPKESQGGGYQY